MSRKYSFFKTQTPTNDSDYTQTISKGFEFVPNECVVTKFSIVAESNLKLVVENGDTTMELYLKQGTSWNVDNDDVYSFTSIKCDNTSARVTYILGYREK